MQPIPFDIIAIEVAKIDLQSIDGFDFYGEFLDACGWTVLEFEKEELRRIDRQWNSEERQCCLS